MTCFCGATDCPSCGPAQGYTVRKRASGGYYNPSHCTRCGDEFHEDDLNESGLCSDCAEIVADELLLENRPELHVARTGSDPLFREFIDGNGVRHGQLLDNEDYYLFHALMAGRPLDRCNAVPIGCHMLINEDTIVGQLYHL